MASGFPSTPNLAVVLTLSFIFLSNIVHTSSPAPPPYPAQSLLPGHDGDDFVTADEKEMGFLGLIVTAALFVFMALLLTCLICLSGRSTGGMEGTILKVQVVLSARAGDVGSVLRDIFANTNRPEPIAESKKTVLKETINALLRHQNSFIYGSTSVKVKPVGDVATFAIGPLEGMVRKELKNLRIEREYLYNYRFVPKLARKQDKDYTVVVIMVLAHGGHKLPLVVSSMDVKEALDYLVTEVPGILDVEVMWGYQDPLLIGELLDIYPNLNSILA